jgi:hypothetical protein
MPSLAWSTVAVIALLLPGFFFPVGFYSPERFSRDLSPRNPLAALAAVVSVSILVHAAMLWVFPHAGGGTVSWAAILDAVQLQSAAAGGAGGSATQRAAVQFQEHAAAIAGYLALSCTMGFLMGWCLGQATVRGWLPFLMTYPWTRRVQMGRGGAMTYAHVLTDVDHDGKLLLYRGRIRHFSLGNNGAFENVVLAATEQRFLLLDGDVPRVGAREPIGGAAREPKPQRQPGWRARGCQWARRSALRRARERLRIVRGAERRLARPDSRVERRRRRQALERDRRRERRERAAARHHLRTEVRTSMRERALRLPLVGTLFLHEGGEPEGALMVISGGAIKDVVFQGTYRIDRLLSVEEEAAGLAVSMAGSREQWIRALEALAYPDEGESEPAAAAAGERGSPAAPPFGVREVQLLLARIGLYPGPIDGVPGRATYAAVRAFQSAHALEPTGMLDAGTVRRLRDLDPALTPQTR